MAQQHKCIVQLSAWAKEFGLKTVAANDVHFLNREDHEAHDVMICIGTAANVHDEKRLRYSPEVYFKTPEEMRALFDEMPEACDNTLEIAERCNVKLQLDSTSIEKYPQVPRRPTASTRESYLRQLCLEGLARRYGRDRALNDDDAARAPRLRTGRHQQDELHELLPHRLGLHQVGARSTASPSGPGRGSAAGSLVAYALGITDIDPLRFGLLFERFLNPERVSPPDIDIDFCQTRRGRGHRVRAAEIRRAQRRQIITFGTLGAKSVVRDVARVLGWSYGDARPPREDDPDRAEHRRSRRRVKKNPELEGRHRERPAHRRSSGSTPPSSKA